MAELTKQKKGTYWKSLNDLAQNEAYQKYVENEFPEGASEPPSTTSRRTFLELMGASVAMAGLAACRRPVEKIVPFVKQPENMVPGIPVYYASAMPMAGAVTGLLVESNEGRPTKIEGNPDHPASLGATNRYHQAATLDLFDPDRSRNIVHNGKKASWADFVSFAKEHFNVDRKVAFIVEDSASPSLQRLKKDASSKFENVVWVTYEPFMEENRHLGNEQVLGKRARSVYHLDKAKCVVSLDDDFLESPSYGVRYARDFAQSRNVDEGKSPSRLYVAEANYSVTGSMADHRLRVKPSQVEGVLSAIAGLLSDVSGLSQFNTYSNEFSQKDWVKRAASDLKAHAGSSLLALGANHSADAHAVAAAINIALGNQGKTISFHDVPFLSENRGTAALKGLVEQIKNGRFETVVLLGTNPVFTAPADLEMVEVLKAVTSIHVSPYMDETSSICNWHINAAHFLESWGDGWSYAGDKSIIQPLVQPLFDGKSYLEVANLIIHGADEKGQDIVKSTWKSEFSGSFQNSWKTVLHDGVKKDQFKSITGNLRRFKSKFVWKASNDTYELNLSKDPKLFDGRFSNNGWLQELPDPITKVTWDNVALVSVATAQKLDVFSQVGVTGEGEADLVEITTRDGLKQKAAVWVVPGHADDVITFYAGNGRSKAGRVGDNTGFNAYALSSVSNPVFSGITGIHKLGERYPVACTQDHHSMEGRPLVREADYEEYKANPSFAATMVKVPGPKEAENDPFDLFSQQTFPDYEPQWGMTIDLNSCIGCGVCTIACQSENNIPVVGKDQVRRGREMHWIRTDRYFSGDLDNPEIVHQPIACQHCEMAPCEQVCPVAATVHSDDGLNQMTYNRCIGTRYCANNCPFKVRRFNFFNYPKEYLTTGNDPEIIQMAMNPEVTVRFRGVMEKCTFCVQRINRAKIDTKNKTGKSVKPEDGAVKTACQQACPTNAISFGDLTDKKSVVSTKKKNDRNYLLLEELNIRPRNSYLARIRNYNKEMA